MFVSDNRFLPWQTGDENRKQEMEISTEGGMQQPFSLQQSLMKPGAWWNGIIRKKRFEPMPKLPLCEYAITEAPGSILGYNCVKLHIKVVSSLTALGWLNE
ncbi:MAG: hypothetical protein GVY08_07445 [Bacteroidetes bacterium]|nr:hypothetical protein [Bacteroidota bacterium]